ncbi:hypothetical protein K2X30_04220 [bacterium]|nr:hypothetical protein [bacterium]
MKKILFVVLAGLVVSLSARAENTRVTNPNAMSLEVMGHAGIWSINYDRAVDESLVAGIGFGTTVWNSSAFPAYVNYYFLKEQSSLYLTAGVTIFGSSTLNTIFGDLRTSSSVVGNVGLGYEVRSDAGFLVRLTAYGFFGGNTFQPWGGLSLGWSF